jgi:hypothetical protein
LGKIFGKYQWGVDLHCRQLLVQAILIIPWGIMGTKAAETLKISTFVQQHQK